LKNMYIPPVTIYFNQKTTISLALRGCWYVVCPYILPSLILLLVVVFSLWAGLAGTRAQSGDRYGSGTLRSRQVLRGRFPLLSPAFRHSHLRRQMLPRPHQRERSLVAKGGIIGREMAD
jgi:hypothetical protein